jgi:glutathione synthase/RimK-type ligase-like ATP-grasp enzyme
MKTYLAVTDKAELFRTAKRLIIAMPETLFSGDFTNRDELFREADRIGYPLVVKPCFSKVRGGNGWTSAGARYASGREELEKIVSGDVFQGCPFLIQEKIEGPGVGVILLMDRGKTLARFCHKRIREKPPSGGVSVLCESIEPPRMRSPSP